MGRRLKRVVAIQRRAKARYCAGELSQRDFFLLNKRVGLLCERSSYLTRERARHNKLLVKSLEMLGRVRTACQSDGLVVAVDCGYFLRKGHFELEEVGISEYRAGVLSFRNLVTENGVHRISNDVPHPSSDRLHGPRNIEKFLFGQSEQSSVSGVREIIRDLTAEADAVVVYSGSNDCRLLQVSYDGPKILDLHHLSWAWFGRSHPTLADFCASQGIDVRNAHCSGNDSAYTLKLVLRLAIERQKLTNGAMRMARHNENYQIARHAEVMCPTRRVLGIPIDQFRDRGSPGSSGSPLSEDQVPGS